VIERPCLLGLGHEGRHLDAFVWNQTDASVQHLTEPTIPGYVNSRAPLRPRWHLLTSVPYKKRRRMATLPNVPTAVPDLPILNADFTLTELRNEHVNDRVRPPLSF
jgi:hypothetical protein